jgi:hypothetical protein
MPYRMTESDPTITFDEQNVEKKLAAFLKNNSITTQAGYDSLIDTVIDGTTLTNAAKTMFKGFFKALITVG